MQWRDGQQINMAAQGADFILNNGDETLVLSPTLRLKGGIPVGRPSAGSVGVNGAFSLNTALPFALPKAYFYFPDNAFYPTSAAGFYYVEMSSAVNGIAFDNLLGLNARALPPEVKVPFNTASVGAFSYTAGQTIEYARRLIPAGFMGSNGDITGKTFWAMRASVQNKTISVGFGNANAYTFPFSGGTENSAYWDVVVQNLTSTSQTITGGTVPITLSASATKRMDQNTAIDLPFTFKGAVTSQDDYLILLHYNLVVTP